MSMPELIIWTCFVISIEKYNTKHHRTVGWKESVGAHLVRAVSSTSQASVGFILKIIKDGNFLVLLGSLHWAFQNNSSGQKYGIG